MRGDGSGAAPAPAIASDASASQSAPTAMEYMQGSDDENFEYLRRGE